jgi:hypothetical protein
MTTPSTISCQPVPSITPTILMRYSSGRPLPTSTQCAAMSPAGVLSGRAPRVDRARRCGGLVGPVLDPVSPSRSASRSSRGNPNGGTRCAASGREGLIGKKSPPNPVANYPNVARALRAAGMEGAEAGYAFYMRIVREEPDDDLRAEVRQSVVLLGLVAVIVVIGLMLGLAL